MAVKTRNLYVNGTKVQGIVVTNPNGTKPTVEKLIKNGTTVFNTVVSAPSITQVTTVWTGSENKYKVTVKNNDSESCYITVAVYGEDGNEAYNAIGLASGASASLVMDMCSSSGLDYAEATARYTLVVSGVILGDVYSDYASY